MTWARLDDTMPSHPKIMGLSAHAFRLHITAICHSAHHLTDGEVEPAVAKGIGGKPKYIQELVDAGLWHELEDGGWEIHDYLAYNPTRESVVAKRAQAAERVNRHREKATRRNASRNALPTQPVTPTPDPGQIPSLKGQEPEQPSPANLTIEITEETMAALRSLLDELERRGAADKNTEGVLLERAKRGAGPADFHDAKQGLTTGKRIRNAAGYAVTTIDNRLKARVA